MSPHSRTIRDHKDKQNWGILSRKAASERTDHIEASPIPQHAMRLGQALMYSMSSSKDRNLGTVSGFRCPRLS